jgi:uncharacterized protein involved in exopolysaccharide biosynthesis
MVSVGKGVSLSDAELVVTSGRSRGQRFRMDVPSKTLGSSTPADIQLDDRRISEMHAMVVERDGAHVVFDLGSETGTFVNGQRADEAILQDGDEFRIGDTIIRYEINPPNVQEAVIVEAQPFSVPGLSPLIAARAQRQLPPGPGAMVPYSPPPVAPQVYISQAPAPYVAPARPVPRASGSDDEDSMSLEDLVIKIRRAIEFFRPYTISILLFAMIGGLLGLSLFFVNPPSRKAVFALSLVANLADNPVDARQPSQRPSLEFFRSADINFKSPALIEKTLAALGEVDADQGRIQAIQRNLQFGATSLMSSTYLGMYEAKDPEEALRFLNAHLKLYLDAEIDKTLKVITGQVEFLEKQVAETERDLRRTEWELLEFKKKNLDSLPEQARQNYDLLFDLQKQQVANEREVSRIAALKAADYSRLKDEKALVPSRVSSTKPYQAAIVDLNRKIAEARARGMGPDHPEMIRMRNEVDELARLAKEAVEKGDETEVEKQLNPVYTNIKDNLRQLEAAERTAHLEKDRIAKELTRVRGVVDRLPELESTFAELTRSYDARKQIHSRIFHQLESAKLQLQLERASAAARYDIIAPPTVEVSSPVRGIVMRVMAGGFAGLLAGLVFATYRRLRGRIAAAVASDETSLARIS